MKKIQSTAIILAIATFISACSSMPATTSQLDQARSDYAAAAANPNISKYAALEMKRAGEALDVANAAARERESNEKIDSLAYLAKQKIAVTQEVAKQKSAEASVAQSAKDRDQIRLDQRTAEADRANANAEQSKLAAQVAQGQVSDAQKKTQEAEARTAALEAQLAAQLADLAAKKTERGMVITMGDVLFGTNLSNLSSDGMRTAQKLAEVLQQNPQRTVLVEGFTDSVGTAAHNQELSERRATAVRAALQGMGVSRDRVGIRGYGESYPIAANDTGSNRQLNRRVEIVLSDATGKVAQR